MKIIEQLELADLKNAFSKYLDTTLTPGNQKRDEWVKFWNYLSKKCSVVDKI